MWVNDIVSLFCEYIKNVIYEKNTKKAFVFNFDTIELHFSKANLRGIFGLICFCNGDVFFVFSELLASELCVQLCVQIIPQHARESS